MQLRGVVVVFILSSLVLFLPVPSNVFSIAVVNANRTFVSKPPLDLKKVQKHLYIDIPLEQIRSAYLSTNNWTNKIKASIEEKTKWKKDWLQFGSIPPWPKNKLTPYRLSQAMTNYDLLDLPTKFLKPKYTYVPRDGPTLVIFSYYETPLNHKNAAFFFRHHNPKWADVLLVVNGRKHSLKLPFWVKVLKRENIGLEFCAMMEILPLLLHGKPLDRDKELLALWRKKYSYFVLLNASVRGPFYPLWAWEACNWVEVFKRQLSKEVWLVGTSFNCMKNLPSLYHLQSFSLMTHREGLALIYEDFQQRLLILKANNQSCDVAEEFDEPEKESVIFVYEIGMTQTFLRRNIGIKSLSLGWQGIDFKFPERVNMICMGQQDQYYPKRYFGIDLSPFEVIFYKTNTADERVDMDKVDLYTLWFDKSIGKCLV